MAAAHKRDGIAMAKLLMWLESCDPSALDEVDVDEKITSLRSQQQGYLDNSFDTIAGYGANGAVIHYRATADKATKLGRDNLLLIDSGGQYEDGTTDVTRTVHLGKPTQKQRECFTRVLKGHIALASAIFPEGTPGFVVDAFARGPLWQAGMDYRHGTGHGVGACLGVHEGPQSISQRYQNRTGLEEGMVVSNEPGFYLPGEFGIRIENLLVITEHQVGFGNTKFLRFEPLTLVPIQHSLMDQLCFGLSSCSGSGTADRK